jgi:hypothetical protein
MNTVKPETQIKIQSLRRLLTTWGYDANDFVFEQEQGSELARLFGLRNGLLRVSRRSTGEERLYATCIESSWFGALLRDLAAGRFADAPESAPGPLVDIVRRRLEVS